MRTLLLLSLASLLTGCISFNSSESPAAPDYVAFCQQKEAQCKQICADAGVQSFSCRAAPREGLEYQCQCKKAGVTL
jgi:hypothetical protein